MDNPGNTDGMQEDALADVLEVIQGKRERPNVWVEIVEQPSPNGVRYRYASEGRASNLQGARSTEANPTYPTIRLNGPDVSAVTDFVVIISLVTDEPGAPFRPHPHKLIGDHCTDGFFHMQYTDGKNTATFMSLGIQCMKKGEEEASLKLRAERKINPFKTPYDPNRTYDKNTVRLCFQVYIRTAAHGERHRLRPVVSEPVRDKRDNLIISRISHTSSMARGGMHMILLCERVKKDEIEVQFREIDPATGDLLWMANGVFDDSDVHRQVAISLKTPPYRDQNIVNPRSCFIRLHNRRTHATSDDLRFEFTPNDISEERRRKRTIRNNIFMKKTNDAALENYRKTAQQQQNTATLPSFRDSFQQSAQPETSTNEAEQPKLITAHDLTSVLDGIDLCVHSSELEKLALALECLPAPPHISQDINEILFETGKLGISNL